MKNNLQLLAYLTNGHWQKVCKEKYLNIWINNSLDKFRKNLSNEFEVNIEIIEENESLDLESESSRTKEKIIEIKPDIILNLPRPIIDSIGIDYFVNSDCIVFSQGKFEEEEISKTNIFSVYSKLFDPIESSIWFAKQTKAKKLFVFTKKGLTYEDFKRHDLIKNYNLSIEIISINKDQESKIINGRKVEHNDEKFVTEIKDFSEDDIKTVKSFILDKKLQIDEHSLVVHDLGNLSYFVVKTLVKLYGDINIFDLGSSGWVPENTQKYFHKHQIFPSYRVRKEINDFFGDLSDFQNMDLDELYRDLYDQLFCVEYVINKYRIKYLSRKDFLSEIKENLRRMKSVPDIFVGNYRNISFEGNMMGIKGSYFYKQGEILEIDKNISLYYKSQPDPFNHKNILNVWYVYLDIISIKHVDISKGLWFCEFEIEINSPIPEAIDHIKFLNNSSLDDLWDVKKISQRGVEGRYQSKYRVHASFDFSTRNHDYPFDAQEIGIEYCLEPSVKDSILQPTPQGYVDDTFEIEGWVIMDSLAGTLDIKSFEKEGTSLKTLPVINSHVKNEWKVRRKSSLASVKSFIPLYILLFLCWYSSFLDFSESTTAVGLNTTVFLAGIALYFSAEKPNTTVLTIIDKFFIFFYCSIAVLIASEFSIFFGENVYRIVHLFWQISIPLIALSSIIFLINKSKIKVKG